jgi:hypothetical protein
MEREPRSSEHLPRFNPSELERRPESNESPKESLERPEQRQERLRTARETLKHQPEIQAPAHEKENEPHQPVTKLDRVMNYRHTMKSLQRDLKPVSRSFSKFIHAPVIEKMSEVGAKTVFRPSVTLGASLTALMVGGVAFITARRYGFSLSGSEFLFALLLGGVIGAFLEGVGKILHRKH